ncbi:MAG: RNA polymerase sigma factor, partial [Myxococcota bacterium]
MSEAAWVAATLVDARPQVIGALLRYFRELDTAEDAFQEASLRALARWPRTGPPRDPVAWLVLVARNTAIDGKRRARRNEALPEDDELSEPGDAEAREVERLDTADFRDDSLRLLFMCSHPKLGAAQQIALSLRVVSGLSVPEIARAFLVSEAAMEQRLTRAKRTIAETPIPFEAPGPAERRARIEGVAASLYLLFNEGYAASGGEQRVRAPLCEEAIRLSRLLLSLFPEEADVCGLTALFLLQHARARARVDENGEIVLLDDQDRALWDRELIDEGLALVEKAMLRGDGGRYALQAAIAAEHARAASAERTDWPRIERLYEALERLAPSPVVTLNR